MAIRRLWYLALVSGLGLVACDAPSRVAGSTAQIGGYSVRWQPVPAFENRVANGLTPLLFTFDATSETDPSNVTEADFERYAAARGITVEIAKLTLGSSAYKTRDGSLASCTIAAIQRGLCGKPLGLSVAQRADLARQVLGRSAECMWVGFNSAYHASAARASGAEDFTLHVAARCG